MAYSAAITITRKGNDYLVQLDELEAGAATETSFQIPVRGRLLRQQATLVSGTGTTIQPILGNATNPSAAAASLVVSASGAAATQDNMSDPAVPYVSATGTLFHRSICDAGADNTVTTLYYISGSTAGRGW